MLAISANLMRAFYNKTKYRHLGLEIKTCKIKMTPGVGYDPNAGTVKVHLYTSTKRSVASARRLQMTAQ